MSRNGRRSPPRPRIELRESAAATPEEAAAIAAAIEQFLRDTTPEPAPEDTTSGWLRAALHEGVGLEPDAAAPWGLVVLGKDIQVLGPSSRAG